MVLPTRDLAAQVYDLVARLCSAVGLKASLAAAQASLASEAAAIMGPPLAAAPLCTRSRRTRRRADGPACSSAATPHTLAEDHQGQPVLLEGADEEDEEGGGVDVGVARRCVDVLVATPGRLMAHLHQTPGFTLRHLAYLVVDESDRLLRQSYQEWLPGVIQQLAQPSHWAAGWAAALPPPPQGTLPFGAPRCVKLIVSATLTRDPSKLARLALHCPRYVATSSQDHRYHLPRSLQEYKLRCSGARKPLVLLALLRELKEQSTVVFASSLETTHKWVVVQACVIACNAWIKGAGV